MLSQPPPRLKPGVIHCGTHKDELNRTPARVESYICAPFTRVITVALKVSCPTARLIILRRSAVEAATLHCLDSSVPISSSSPWDITDYNSVHWVCKTQRYACRLNDAALQSPTFWDSLARWWNCSATIKVWLACSTCFMTKSFCLLLSPLWGEIQKVQWAGTEVRFKLHYKESRSHRKPVVHSPTLVLLAFFFGIVNWEIAQKML